MIVSSIIILLSSGGVEIQEVGALGTKLVFGRKDALYVALWVIFFYFLIRYYQYFLEEKDRGIATSYRRKVDALLHGALIQAAATQHSLPLDQVAGEFNYWTLKKTSSLVRTGTVVTGRDQEHTPIFSEYRINTLRCIPALVRAALHVAVNRSVLTDFFLPFLVALGAVMAAFSGSWEGSLCKVVEWQVFQCLCS